MPPSRCVCHTDLARVVTACACCPAFQPPPVLCSSLLHSKRRLQDDTGTVLQQHLIAFCRRLLQELFKCVEELGGRYLISE